MKNIKASDLELKEKVVSIQRVAKVVKGGRRFSFSAIVVVGNENGVVGYGLGKANEVTNAIIKGTDDAKKNLINVPVYKNTIPHEVLGKYGGGGSYEACICRNRSNCWWSNESSYGKCWDKRCFSKVKRFFKSS